VLFVFLTSIPFTRKKPTGPIPCCYPSLMLAHHHCGDWAQGLQNERGRNAIYILSSFWSIHGLKDAVGLDL